MLMWEERGKDSSGKAQTLVTQSSILICVMPISVSCPCDGALEALSHAGASSYISVYMSIYLIKRPGTTAVLQCVVSGTAWGLWAKL